MKNVERIVIVLLILTLIGGGAWLYFSIKDKQQEIREEVARGAYEIPITPEIPDSVDPSSSATSSTQADWRKYYPIVVPVLIGSTTVMASVADSLPERIKGLSGTPYLPEGIVKLFAFGVNGEHSIWMKDMNYSIDILWVSQEGLIVHIERDVSPDTYPKSFGSPVPAFYVIEANAGFTARSGIEVGDLVVVSLEN